MKTSVGFILCLLCIVACSDNGISSPIQSSPQQIASNQYTTTPQGLLYHDITVGTGEVAEPGHLLTLHYTGWLESGSKFDSSLDRKRSYQFILGVGQVIPGWDIGVSGMRVGGHRQLVIPPSLAYGAAGSPPVIPPNATLIFEVELLDVQ